MAVVLFLQLPLVLNGENLTYALGGFVREPGISLILDGPAWLASALIVLISLMVAIYSLDRPEFDLRYFFFLLMLVAGMEAVVLTGDIFTMFVSLEIIAIAAYVLIAWEKSDEGLLASLKYLFLSSVGILFFLLGVFIVYRDLGTLSFAVIAERIAELKTNPVVLSTLSGENRFPEKIGSILQGYPGRSINFALAALCVGIGVRTAFIPFHTWLPEAHAWAPHPVSALLSGVLIKISFFALFRILAVFHAFHMHSMLMWLGSITALVAVGWALAQSDSKRLLAYHSISQMGYILAAAGAASVFSVPAAYTHAINHALFKGLLFLAIGHAIHMVGERNLFRIGPLGRRSPLIALALLFGALSISGIPPFNGFVSKQLISHALDGSPAYILLWLTAVGTTASFIKLSRIALPGPKDISGFRRHDSNHRHSAATVIPLVILSVLVLLSGVYGAGYTRFVWRLVGDPSVTAMEFPALFKVDKFTDSLIILLLGIALYFLVMSPVGKRVAKRVSGVAPKLGTVLTFFVFGLALFSIAAWR